MKLITKHITVTGNENVPSVSIAADNSATVTFTYSDESGQHHSVVSIPADPAILGERYDHAAYEMVMSSPDDPTDTTFTVENVFKKTLPTKTRYNSMARPAGSMGFLVVPFKDSTPDEWMLVINTKSYEVANGQDVIVVGTVTDDNMATFTHDADEHGTCLKAISLLPNIHLTLNDGVVAVQLQDENGTSISRAGVEIFVETTSGSLSASRIYTDENGAGACNLTGQTTGKVKVGFKYWTGKNEVMF